MLVWGAMALERRRTPRFSQVVKELSAKGQQVRAQGLAPALERGRD
jgi:hypothetical protein